ncbi:MAG: hypothetical protein M3310_01930 [Actinomycetota bacterium]|nr:hypothetical protein [Actinomycetota bacterium]
MREVDAAAAGLPVAAATVIESIRRAGRPLMWFTFVVAVYARGALAYYALHVL